MSDLILASIVLPLCFVAGYLAARIRDERTAPPSVESEIVILLDNLRQLERRSANCDAGMADFLSKARELIFLAIEEYRAPCLTNNRPVYFRRALISEYLMKARQELALAKTFEE
ncbi:MAG: hypothetical protein IPK73_05385 [Candidatus Obscuribacter sp.]|nr:hypothetical protein [Candidatus Obscuribacter sp.]MBK9279030.1 hypothetical protein [Candidatus Obscuribacter sp.]